ncbi:MAG: TetR/AcrR family transcriptional regulator [Muribaculaceae bacterium]|nr:TetR/AcrR family transcriptional regulator [Muribaculaceae bacterium]
MDKNYQAEAQNTEQKIIEAAEQEFLIKGFDGARTTSIAAKAGVTHAMFHYYFRTKEKIFEKIISQKLELLTKLIMDSISLENLSLEEKLKRIIESHIDFVSENPELPGFLVREIFNNPERFEILKARFETFAPLLIQNLQKELDKGFEKGKYRKTDARMMLIDIISLNIFPYMASPLINSILTGFMTDKENFKELRKKENFETIMRKIKA